jgi:hypothetical protein
MGKKKNGRELADGLYRELEKTYPIKIENGEVELKEDVPLRLFNDLHKVVDTIEHSLAKLPALERPSKGRGSKRGSPTLHS